MSVLTASHLDKVGALLAYFVVEINTRLTQQLEKLKEDPRDGRSMTDQPVAPHQRDKLADTQLV
jgi:hypothetical protein